MTPFDPVYIETNTFHLDKYKAVKVPMMYKAYKFASTVDENFFFFWPLLWHIEVPRPGIECIAQQWPKPWYWQPRSLTTRPTGNSQKNFHCHILKLPYCGNATYQWSSWGRWVATSPLMTTWTQIWWKCDSETWKSETWKFSFWSSNQIRCMRCTNCLSIWESGESSHPELTWVNSQLV